ncbi:MAG: radical SAM protein [Patescibacteria group bacterium]|nr:radical SAM protein [Patescibacteria group bacterium]
MKGLFYNLKYFNLIIKRPKVILKLLKHLYSNLILKRPCLRVVELVINTECNSNCVMCYATRYNLPKRKKNSLEDIRKIWTQAEKLGAYICIVQGGEAILHPQFWEILEVLKPFSNIILLVSNGIALDEKVIKKLKEKGLSMLHLSLNSTDPKTHDKIRGYKGNFEKNMKVIANCKKFGLPVYFSSILQHDNKKEFLKIVELAKKIKIGISGALLVSMGKAADQKRNRVTLKDREWLLELLKKEKYLLNFDWVNNLSGRFSCPAGNEKIAVSVYGEIMSCVCNHLSFGNALKEPLEVIYSRMQNFSLFKERNPLCLASFNTKYRREYLDPIAESKFYPVSIFEHPKHPAKLIKGKMIER